MENKCISWQKKIYISSPQKQQQQQQQHMFNNMAKRKTKQGAPKLVLKTSSDSSLAGQNN